MSRSSSSSSPQPALLLPLARSLFGFELLLHPVVFAIGLANLAVLCHTRILNPNLRSVLIAQSASIALYEVVVLPNVVQKLTAEHSSTAIFMEDIIVFVFTSRNCLGHVLLLERLLATVYARDYQHFGWKWFTGGWALVVLSLSLANAISIDMAESALTNIVLFIFTCACAFFSLVELAAICLIGAHNLKRYTHTVPDVQGPGYSLNEKFQLFENIRTSRQLSPAFLCHFLDNINSLSFTMVDYFDWISLPELTNMQFSATVILYSLSGALISITVITHHPALKKQLIGVALHCLPWKRGNRVDNVINGGREQEGTLALRRSIHGTALVGKSEIEEHFRSLQASWA